MKESLYIGRSLVASRLWFRRSGTVRFWLRFGRYHLGQKFGGIEHCLSARPMQTLERLVKPERDRVKQKDARESWWRFTRPRHELYEALNGLNYALALSRHGNTLAPPRVPTGPVFSEATVVFALDSYADLATLSSSMHSIWAMRYTSTMRTDIRYSPSDVFLTFPRPGPSPERSEEH